MLTIQFKNNTVTITQGGEPKVLQNSAKEDTKENSKPAAVSGAATEQDAKDAPKKGGGDEGQTGSGGGGPGSVVVVGPIIMTAFSSAQRRPILSEPIVKHAGLGVSHEAKVAGTNRASTSENAGSNQKGSGDEGQTGPGGGGPGSVIVIGPIVIQNSPDEGSSVQSDKAQQAGAGAATLTRDRS